MSGVEKVYRSVPIALQNVMVSVAGWLKNRHRYGKVYHAHRAFLVEFDAWSAEEKQAYQNETLIRFVRHAVTHSPFYAALYADVDVDAIQMTQDLDRLPRIDKEALRLHLDDVLTVAKKGAIKEQTGGTTGKSLVIYKTPADEMKRMATLDHFKARVGFEPRKMKRAIFNAKPIVPPKQTKKVFWRYNAASKQMIYTPFRLSEENLPHYVASLNRFKPAAIEGYLSAMCDVANYIERHLIALTFVPVAIFPTSETLTEPARQLLERVFKCKVYDQYASSEGAPFVTMCPLQTRHVEPSTGVFEHFENGSDEVLVTSFTTHGTPLIRYQIGDAMTFDDQATCACGLNTPIVKAIQGRKLDFLYTAEGVRVNAANVANLFKIVEGAVIKAQAIQDVREVVTVLLQVDGAVYEKKKHEAQLYEAFEQRFGLKTKLVIRYVDQIPREKSGKFRMIKNNVKRSD